MAKNGIDGGIQGGILYALAGCGPRPWPDPRKARLGGLPRRGTHGAAEVAVRFANKGARGT